MKISRKWPALIILMAAVLATSTIFAQTKRLPDLTVEKIYLTTDCNVAVVVKNLGPGHVPDEVWTVCTPQSAGVYLYKNGAGWGGAGIWKFDPAKNLQKPGGTATYVSKLKISGTKTITAVVDLWKVVAEANEGNNKHTARLTCEAQSGQSR